MSLNTIKPAPFIQIVFILIMVLLSCKKEDKSEDPKPNQPPTCVITSPSNGQLYHIGDTVLIEVKVSDDGIISAVQLTINNDTPADLSGPPYEYLLYTSAFSTGSFSIKVIVMDNVGELTEDEIYIKLSDETPIAGFRADTIYGVPPLNVEFRDQSLNNPTNYYWDFGDGESSTEQNPSHTYVDRGEYSVSLIVSSKYGKDTSVMDDPIKVGEYMIDPRDGQHYFIVSIGSQTWFAENINIDISGSRCYNDDPANCEIYGRLYGAWGPSYAACPEGWHLPSDDEWKTLEISLGMTPVEADQEGWRGASLAQHLKSTSGWKNNGNGTNSSGFNALPGGSQSWDPANDIEENGFWWTSTLTPDGHFQYMRVLQYDKTTIGRGTDDFSWENSVRCLKND